MHKLQNKDPEITEVKYILLIGFIVLLLYTSIDNVFALIPTQVQNVTALAWVEKVKVTWDKLTATPSVDRYWIERNGTVIDNTDNVNVLDDDFSSYPDNATGDAVWIPTIASGQAIIGVDVTNGSFHDMAIFDGSFEQPDSISIHTSNGSAIRFASDRFSSQFVTLDLRNLIGRNVTDASGVGDFTLRWTQESVWCRDNNPVGSPQAGANCYNNRLSVGLSSKNDRWFSSSSGETRDALIAEWQQRQDSVFQNIFGLYSQDNSVRTFKAQDTTCGDGSLTRTLTSHYDSATPASSKFGKQNLVYLELNKTGTTYKLRAGLNPSYTGLSCSVTSTFAATYSDLRYLILSYEKGGTVASTPTNEYRFDNFQMTISGGEPINFYFDNNVQKGTNYIYNVFAENADGNGTAGTSNVVLTNDVPAQVQNLTSNYVSSSQIFSDWNDLATNSGTGNPIGIGTTLTKYNVFIRNLSTPPFVLDGTTIPPTSEFFHSSSFPTEKEITVQGCNQLGCGDNSTIAQVFGFPFSVPVLTASNNINNGINSTWTMANQAGVSGYTLFNSSDNITFDTLAIVANGTLFFFDTPHPVCFDSYYKVRAFTSVRNGTNSTSAFGSVDCFFTAIFGIPTIENVGDTFKITGNVNFIGGNLTKIELLENGIITDINSTGFNSTNPATSNQFNYLFWERDTVGGVANYTVKTTGQSPNWQLLTEKQFDLVTREYDPFHFEAIVENQGKVNYTIVRSPITNNIDLKVNRVNVPSGETWQIECIYQTVQEAIATKDSVVPEQPTVRWLGTWDNATNTGFLKSLYTGGGNNHVYISCFNEDLLFSTVSYSNSSLALFGIEAFDVSFGSLIGVPAGIFMLVLMAGMANKRTSPTWIVVIIGAAGMMSVIGFFTLDPIVWGLGLLTAMLGLFVNQKVF